MASPCGVTRLAVVGMLFALCTIQGDAFFNFDSLFNDVTSNLKSMIDDTMQKVTETFSSVLSGIGDLPEGATRGSIAFASIINGAFSRKNGINVDGAPVDTDWKLDGNGALAGIVGGAGDGAVGVSVSDNGRVSFSISKRPKPNESKGSSPTPTASPTLSPTVSPSPYYPPADASPYPSPSPSSSPPLTIVQAIDLQMENWDDFVTSNLWKTQDDAANGQKEEDEQSENDENLSTRTRIVNGLFFGESLAAGSSFAVKFFYNDEKNFYCSGSLIGYPWVLTAAHCGVVKGDQVRVGGRLLRSGYKGTVGEVHIHPDFDRRTLRNDIALVRVDGLESKKVLNQNGIKAASICKRKDFPKSGNVLVVSGHGSTRPDGQGYSDEILSTRQTVLKDQKCAEEITQGEISDAPDYLCAGDGERSTTCVGDSGGGLWHYVTKRKKNKPVKNFFEIVGVVSFGEVTDESLCPKGPPTVYQEVSRHQEWIINRVGKKNMA